MAEQFWDKQKDFIRFFFKNNLIITLFRQFLQDLRRKTAFFFGWEGAVLL
jgi:hypothetical protein